MAAWRTINSRGFVEGRTDSTPVEKRENGAREDSDIDLLRRYLKGDEDAFSRFYERHLHRVQEVCFFRLTNPLDAEEATEDTFINAAKHAAQAVGHDGSLKQWLRRIATRKCSDALDRLQATKRMSPGRVTPSLTDLDLAGTLHENYVPWLPEAAVIQAEEYAEQIRQLEDALTLWKAFRSQPGYDRRRPHWGAPQGVNKTDYRAFDAAERRLIRAGLVVVDPSTRTTRLRAPGDDFPRERGLPKSETDIPTLHSGGREVT